MTFHLYGGQGKDGGVIIGFQDIPYYALRGFVVIPPTPAFSLACEEGHMEIYRSGIFTQPSPNDLWRGGGAVGDH